MRYDLVSLGEPLLRLSPPGCGQLRRAASLDLFVVGSQLNVAANLARLGKQAAFVTKLPDNPLGLLALDACRSYGLDVSHVRLVPGTRIGVTYVEFSAVPRAPLVVYDRAGSAASTIAAADFDWDKLTVEAAYAYTDGIFPGLSASCAEAAHAFFTAARGRGCTTCFDVNYREHLWAPAEARAVWAGLLPQVTMLATSRDVTELVFGRGGSDEDLLRWYQDAFGCRVVCLTRRRMLGLRAGACEATALADGHIWHGKRREFDVVDRYGTGDAWFAGFLYGCMHLDVESALSFANALCALAHTMPGDVAHVTTEEVRRVMEGDVDLRVRR